MDLDHGEVSLKVEDNIIFVWLIGSFNEYGAQKYTQGVKAEVEKLKGKPFSILVNNAQLIGGTPEAYAELEQYNIWLNTQNLIAKAMVVNSPTTTNLINMYSPSRKQQVTKEFNNEQEAIDWLNSFKQH